MDKKSNFDGDVASTPGQYDKSNSRMFRFARSETKLINSWLIGMFRSTDAALYVSMSPPANNMAGRK